jgi:hypothetical protein
MDYHKSRSINPEFMKHKQEPKFNPKPIIDENRDFIIDFEEKGISD